MPTTWDMHDVEGPAEEIVVTCDEHGLNKTVDSVRYAVNLVNYHNRHEHPDAPEIQVGTIFADPHCGKKPEQTYDITAAAQVLVDVLDSNATGWGNVDPTYQAAALTFWKALTGLQGDVAIDLAREIAKRPTTAYVPPF